MQDKRQTRISRIDTNRKKNAEKSKRKKIKFNHGKTRINTDDSKLQ